MSANDMRRRILFIHQNLPGQFRHLLAYCARHPVFEVAVIGEKRRILANFPRAMAGVAFHVYEVVEISPEQLPPELWSTANAMRRGRAAALCLQNLRDAGFRPEVIYGHPGWGEMLHVKDIFPDARVVNYCEFYFNTSGQDLCFDPEYQQEAVDVYQVRTDNIVQLASLIEADAGISPTRWQQSCYPELLRQRITVVHDGIDLDVAKPHADARLPLPGSTAVLTKDDQVITYVSRNLEPYRGFPTFMRALPEILNRLPRAQVVIVGGDDVSYSKRLPDGMTYREIMLAELGHGLDLSRIHFLGRIPYADYLRVLQISSVHVYLTYPFVLSWSMLEAMACGAVVVGSRTAPVREVIEDGVNGFLTDFFSHEALADRIYEACAACDELMPMREAARSTIAKHYNLRPDGLSRQLALLFPEG